MLKFMNTFKILTLPVLCATGIAHANVTPSNIAWQDLPFQDAIKIKKGNGKRQLALISDPRCSGCRKFAKELDKINNITIYVFPVAYFDGSDQIIQNIWCSNARTHRWNNLMLNNQSPPTAKQCKTPTSRNLALSEKLGVQAIPSYVLYNSVFVNGGSMSAEGFEEILQFVHPE